MLGRGDSDVIDEAYPPLGRASREPKMGEISKSLMVSCQELLEEMLYLLCSIIGYLDLDLFKRKSQGLYGVWVVGVKFLTYAAMRKQLMIEVFQETAMYM